MKAFLIKIQKSGVWWAFDAAVLPVSASYAIRHFTNFIIIVIIIIIISAIGFSPGGSGYFTCTQNMKLVTNKFKSGGLHDKRFIYIY